MHEQEPGQVEYSFEEKKRRFFSSLAVEIRDALRLHKEEGLWRRVEQSRDWGNVSEHCLVEAARAKAFSQKLQLPDTICRSLVMAAGAHDFFKKGEKDIIARDGPNWEGFDRASREAETRMRAARLPEETIRLAGSVGHTSFKATEQILKKDRLDDADIAFLVMHYIDDYTVNAEWVQPAEQTTAGDRNDLDRRVDKNEANERYRVLSEDGRGHFDGETTFQAQRRIGHAVENRLAILLQERTGTPVNPKQIPESIDADIRSQIEELGQV